MFCLYEVINHYEPSTKRGKCHFISVKVATKVFVHLLILIFSHDIRLEKLTKNLFYIYMVLLSRNVGFSQNEQKNAGEGEIIHDFSENHVYVNFPSNKNIEKNYLSRKALW